MVGKPVERVDPPLLKPSAIAIPSLRLDDDDFSGEQPETFVVIKDSQSSEKQKASLNHRLKVATRIFDILSSSSSIDHPLCLECTDMVENDLNEQVEEADREREYYKDYLLLNQFVSLNQEEHALLLASISELQEEDSKLLQELREIEAERDAIALSVSQLKEEEAELERLERSFWNEHNEFQAGMEGYCEERDSLTSKYNHAKQQLEKLRRTNVYNDAFRISHDGYFGTINNFRLGRLPNQPVEWNEINAAWGQALLLLKTIANRIGFRFQTYELIPNGSFSKIERKADGKVFDLFTTGEFGRFFKSGRSDAMVAFLECLQQLATHASKKDSNFILPYKIEGDKVGGVSIKAQFNDLEWTKSLKFTLANLKWLLAWASQQH